MTERPEDTDLRALFDAQKRDDAAHAPAFTDVVARARLEAGAFSTSTMRPIRIPHRRRWLGLAAAAAITALILVPRMSGGEDAFEEAVRSFRSDPALGAWQSPTDGLLSMPGDRLLTTVPAIGIEQ